MELKVLEHQRERPLHLMYSELHLRDASTKDPNAKSPHCVKEAKTDHRLVTRFRPRRARPATCPTSNGGCFLAGIFIPGRLV